MPSQRWVRIIPVALIMYTIAYIDRTNVMLAMKSMIADLHMDKEQAGRMVGVFFWGYLLLQVPGGYLAGRWSAKWFVSILLVLWGACAVAGGLVRSLEQLGSQRFFLGVTEGGVFPATLVLLSNWFPRAERARATAFWSLCQPIAVAFSSPISGGLMDIWGWRWMLIIEGALPFLWLLIWIRFIDDHPRKARWISTEEREHIETTLLRESAELEAPEKEPFLKVLLQPQVLILIAIYFLHNCGAYGCMFWLRSAIEGQAELSSTVVGLLSAVPYVLTGFAMVLLARHSDKKGERRGHVAFALSTSGLFLLANVLASGHSFWLAYVFICLSIPGPFANLGPFWAIPTETLPKSVAGTAMGLINAVGNLGGFFGTWLVGSLGEAMGDTKYGFGVLGFCFLGAASLTVFLKKAEKPEAGGR